MNGRPMQLALRELQRDATNPRALAIMAVVAVALGVSGPFGTFESLEPVFRFIYWGLIVFSSYFVGKYAAWLALILLPSSMTTAIWARVLVAGVTASVPVAAVVVAIDLLFYGLDVARSLPVIELWSYCLVMAIGMALVTQLSRRRPVEGGAAPVSSMAGAAPTPQLLSRLPLQSRGRLSHLSMQDHYVEIVTDRGRNLVLLRFGDAIKETAGEPGLQIHRSHWVALWAVKAVKRNEGKVVVEMADGSVLPVSRGYMQQVRESRLLP